MPMTATINDPVVLDSREPCNTSVRCGNRVLGLRENLLLALLLCVVIKSSQVLAADQAANVDHDFETGKDSLPVASPSASSAAAISALPESFSASNLSLQEPHEFSATEFSPRKPTMFDQHPTARVTDMPAAANAGSVRTANAWQRLADYRGLGRVRLLTLWENTGSSVSLQAGKGGGPSLQWTSRAMNHGGSTRGLLDKVFSASLAGAGNAMRNSGGSRAGIAVNPKLPIRSIATTPVKAP